MRGFPDKAFYALRFEVLERDDFTCQYCGQFAPNVILHVDHIISVCDGGGDEIDNLVTACASCNIGKEALRASREGRMGSRARWAARQARNKYNRPNPNEPKWDDMVALEPRLADLLKEAESIKDNGEGAFCPHWYWFGRENGRESLRNRVAMLVGTEAGYEYRELCDPVDEGFVTVGMLPEREREWEVPELLRTCLAYDAACRKVSNALPPHRNCYHTEVQPLLLG